MNYVAILTRRGEKQVQKFVIEENQSITVGRDWNCDVVVDDKYVDPVHINVLLNPNGTLYVSDNSSTNGTRVNKRGITGAIPLPDNGRVSMGDTSLKIVNTDDSVAPAVKSSSSQRWLQTLTSIPGLMLTTVCVGLMGLLSIYVLGHEEATAEIVAGEFVGLALVIAGWSTLAGIIGKVFRGEPRFLSHGVLVGLMFCVAIAVAAVSEVVKFNLNSDTINVLMDCGLYSLLIAVFCYITFTLATNLSVVKKLGVVCLVVLFTVGYLLEPLLLEEQDSWSDWVTESQASQPPEWVFAKPITLDDHLNASNDIFESLEKKLGPTWANAEPEVTADVSQGSDIQASRD